MNKPTHRLKIGMRNIKTATAAAFCALIYFFLDRSPAFACIGAIFGMGSDLETSKLHGGNRVFGTVIGGLLGIVMFRIYLIFHPDGGRSLLLVLLTFIGVVLLILLCQVFWVGGVQPGGVVLSILLFNTPVDSYVSYALNRILDTAIGVIVALVVNSFFPGGFTFQRAEEYCANLNKRMEAFSGYYPQHHQKEHPAPSEAPEQPPEET